MIRVGTMMLGEVDFLGTFLQPVKNLVDQSSKLPIERMQLFTALFFLVIFIILMPILLMNLLIGLAVGDIDTVRKDAQLKRLTMQVDLHTDLERKLPRKFIQFADKIEIFEFPNRCGASSIFVCTVGTIVRNKCNFYLSVVWSICKVHSQSTQQNECLHQFVQV